MYLDYISKIDKTISVNNVLDGRTQVFTPEEIKQHPEIIGVLEGTHPIEELYTEIPLLKSITGYSLPVYKDILFRVEETTNKGISVKLSDWGIKYIHRDAFSSTICDICFILDDTLVLPNFSMEDTTITFDITNVNNKDNLYKLLYLTRNNKELLIDKQNRDLNISTELTKETIIELNNYVSGLEIHNTHMSFGNTISNLIRNYKGMFYLEKYYTGAILDTLIENSYYIKIDVTILYRLLLYLEHTDKYRNELFSIVSDIANKIVH